MLYPIALSQHRPCCLQVGRLKMFSELLKNRLQYLKSVVRASRSTVLIRELRCSTKLPKQRTLLPSAGNGLSKVVLGCLDGSFTPQELTFEAQQLWPEPAVPAWPRPAKV